MARFEPDAPAELQRILTKTLRKDRAQRYQTMQDLLLDLQALREDVQSHARVRERVRHGNHNGACASGSSQTRRRAAATQASRGGSPSQPPCSSLGAALGSVGVENGAPGTDASRAEGHPSIAI